MAGGCKAVVLQPGCIGELPGQLYKNADAWVSPTEVLQSLAPRWRLGIRILKRSSQNEASQVGPCSSSRAVLGVKRGVCNQSLPYTGLRPSGSAQLGCCAE